MNKEKIEIVDLIYPSNFLSVVEGLEKLDYFKELYIDYDSKSIVVESEEVLSKYQKDLLVKILVTNYSEKNNKLHKLSSIMKKDYTLDDDDDDDDDDEDHDHHYEHDEIVSEVSKRIIVKHENKLSEYVLKSNTLKKKHHHDHEEDECHDEECECGHHHHHYHHHHDDECGCGHHHGIEDDDDEEEVSKVNIVLGIIGLAIFIVFVVLHFTIDTNWLIFGFIVSYILIGYDIVWGSIIGIIHGNIFNENLLMVIASVGAMCINEPIEGIMVITLYKIGEFLQDRATDRSKESIKELIELKHDTVTLSTGETKDVKDVNVGDIISIRVGESIPLDGVIKAGSTDVDMKALTGESAPVYLNEGSEILSGSINLSRVIEVEVTKKDSDSTISKVMNLVEEASKQKSKREAFISKFAKIYTPIVLLIALAVFFIEFFAFKQPIRTVLNGVFSILVISCPCALVISIPLSYFAGIGRCSSL